MASPFTPTVPASRSTSSPHPPFDPSRLTKNSRPAVDVGRGGRGTVKEAIYKIHKLTVVLSSIPGLAWRGRGVGVGGRGSGRGDSRKSRRRRRYARSLGSVIQFVFANPFLSLPARFWSGQTACQTKLPGHRRSSPISPAAVNKMTGMT